MGYNRHLFKMKKSFLMLMALCACALMSFAQSSQIAILSHEGNISTYYGVDALKEAYNAAETGDVITLSSGTFNATDISKSITLRGAGMQADPEKGILPTILDGNYSINKTDSSILKLENIYHNGEIRYTTIYNAFFYKCRFNYFRDANYGSNNDIQFDEVTFLHCKIVGGFTITAASRDKNSSYLFRNSIVNDFSIISVAINGNYCRHYATIENSIIICIDLPHARVYNSIVMTDAEETELGDSNSLFYNCVGVHLSYDTDVSFDYAYSYNCSNKVLDASLFKTYRGTYSDSETFELTDEAKTLYLGTDGTEVGIYGGNMPFSPTPLIPQIKRCNVAGKTTVDGKLSVDIEVQGVE